MGCYKRRKDSTKFKEYQKILRNENKGRGLIIVSCEAFSLWLNIRRYKGAFGLLAFFLFMVAKEARIEVCRTKKVRQPSRLSDPFG